MREEFKMKHFFRVRSLLTVSFLLGIAINTASAQDAFKVAVVEDALGTLQIMDGDYQKGLKQLESRSSRARKNYDVATGACVAKIMMKDLEQAKSSCDLAVAAYSGRSGGHYDFLNSVAYSNRSVVLFKMGDTDGALSDLKRAVSIDQNEIASTNLIFLKSKLAVNQVSSEYSLEGVKNTASD